MTQDVVDQCAVGIFFDRNGERGDVQRVVSRQRQIGIRDRHTLMLCFDAML